MNIYLSNRNKRHLRDSTQATIQPLAIILTMDLGHYDGLEEYCSLSTASSVFLRLLFVKCVGHTGQCIHSSHVVQSIKMLICNTSAYLLSN